MALKDDPRADPRMIAAMAPIGLGEQPAESPVHGGSDIEALLEYVTTAEEGFEALFAALSSSLPDVEGVTRSVEIIKGADGNDITLYVHRPTGGPTTQPGILHIHGGGMVLLEAAGGAYVRWRDLLAASGLVVVGVEFRNGGGKHGDHPFPAGLTDCVSALRWVHEHRGELGISTLVVSGESGGGNLTLATALRAKREGDVAMIDGVYAMAPYISGAYADPPLELTSLHENEGYFLDCRSMGALARVYDPDGDHVGDPLAWPYHAPLDELAGLPPHVISVNQLDPLRDEGLAYYRRLAEAGVPVMCRTVNGTCHVGDLIFEAVMPEVTAATVRDIKAFADSL
jgi:acetyl esterase/lipase